MLLASDVLPLKSTAIKPSLHACPRLQVLLPLSLIGTPICMQIGALAMGTIFQPLPFINVTVQLHKAARASGEAVGELALIVTDADTLDLTVAMAVVAAPLADVEGSIIDCSSRLVL